MKLPNSVIKGLKKKGIVAPTPIQIQGKLMRNRSCRPEHMNWIKIYVLPVNSPLHFSLFSARRHSSDFIRSRYDRHCVYRFRENARIYAPHHHVQFGTRNENAIYQGRGTVWPHRVSLEVGFGNALKRRLLTNVRDSIFHCILKRISLLVPSFLPPESWRSKRARI